MFKHQLQMMAVKEKLRLGNTVHVEACRGTWADNVKYIVGPYDKGGKHKEVNEDAVTIVEDGVNAEYPWSSAPVGEERRQKKKDTEVRFVVDELKAGAGLRQLAETVGDRAFRHALVVNQFLQPERNCVPEVWWIYGKTGLGKSALVRRLEPEGLYVKTDGSQWWPGYDGHKAVLLDDFRPKQGGVDFLHLLGLFDRYGYRVQLKGGYQQFYGERIYVTAPVTPQEMFRGVTDEEVDQLLRRISLIIFFKSENLQVTREEIEEMIPQDGVVVVETCRGYSGRTASPESGGVAVPVLDYEMANAARYSDTVAALLDAEQQRALEDAARAMASAEQIPGPQLEVFRQEPLQRQAATGAGSSFVYSLDDDDEDDATAVLASGSAQPAQDEDGADPETTTDTSSYGPEKQDAGGELLQQWLDLCGKADGIYRQMVKQGMVSPVEEEDEEDLD